MNAVRCVVFCFILGLVGCSAGTAPAGSDPVSGTWQGEWGPTPERQTAVTVELHWDGKALSGTVNPGGNGIPLAKASFSPETGAITMELDGPNSRRETVRYVIRGTVTAKTISGTFDRAGEAGTFKIGRE